MTPGRDARDRLGVLRPDDLSGKTVPDLGAWDGFFSFECERRGAARVVAAGARPGIRRRGASLGTPAARPR